MRITKCLIGKSITRTAPLGIDKSYIGDKMHIVDMSDTNMYIADDSPDYWRPRPFNISQWDDGNWDFYYNPANKKYCSQCGSKLS